MSVIVNQDDLIVGEPIETDYAVIRFLTFREHNRIKESLGILGLSTLNIYYHYKEAMQKPSDEDKDFLKAVKDSPLRHIILSDEFFLGHYLNIINKVVEFKEDYDIEMIFKSDELFMELRKLIMDMNLAKEEKAFYNEELQEGIMRSKKMQSSKGEIQTSEDILTCIVAFTSNSFDDVLRMTVYQAYAIYSRLGAGKSYDTEILFATVDNGRKIEPWNKHIDLLAGEKSKDMKREVIMGRDFS